MDEQVLAGFAWFGAALVLHVAAWRWLAPRRQLPWLFGIMLGVPCVLWTCRLHDVRAFVVATSLALAYIQTYPAAQARSPSLMILGAARRLGPGGCVTRADLAAAVRSDMSLDIRFSDLDRERLLVPVDGGLRLTLPGRLLAMAFVTLRRSLNLGPGAG